MDKRTRTWISVVVGILIVLVGLGAAVIGGTVYYVSSHLHEAPVEDVQAGDRFAEVRERLGSRQALLEIDDRDEVQIHRSPSATGPSADNRLRTLKAIIHDPRNGRLVEVDIPFWLLRLMPPGGRFSFLNDRGIDFDSDRTRLTVEDIESHGAGLILDHRNRRGARVLVWTE